MIQPSKVVCFKLRITTWELQVDASVTTGVGCLIIKPIGSSMLVENVPGGQGVDLGFKEPGSVVRLEVSRVHR